MKKLDESDCRACIAAGDFPESVVGAASSVAVVLTQSWCPQWSRMRSYLESTPEDSDLAIFWLEYDREDFFRSFMDFKENVFGNRQVPYVRYYRAGSLVAESNFVDQGRFLALLGPVPRP